MFDVHPPHSPIHGWRDFFVQLVTITAGLLIALALDLQDMDRLYKKFLAQPVAK
jgi:hypothetical protein